MIKKISVNILAIISALIILMLCLFIVEYVKNNRVPGVKIICPNNGFSCHPVK